MANTVKQISIATDSANTYSTRDIGADAINVDVSYDADGNVITDTETTVATKKSSAEAIKTINETLAADAEAINGKAPTSHASADTTYGLGTDENYGHVKLSDDYSSDVTFESHNEAKYGIGASAQALQLAYQELDKLRTDIKDLQITQGGSTGVTITRVPEIVLNPQGNEPDSSGIYQFILQSALSIREMPDTTKLILDFKTEDISSETKAQITVYNDDTSDSYVKTEYTLTANDIAYGYKYVASETTSTTTDEDGTETETTTQTYSYRVEILLRKQVNVTSGVYSLFFESVPNEKYLNNKCDEISAALDVANIPSDLGTTAGSAISALNTHLTDGTVNAGKLQDYSFRLNHNTTDTWIPVISDKNIDYRLVTEMGNFGEQLNRGGFARFGNLIVACIHAQTTSTVSAWTWSIGVPAPKFAISDILDVTGSYRFQINLDGVFQNQTSIASGTYITVFVGYIAK